MSRTDQLIKANIQGFLNVVLNLQHNGESDAALDLTREAFSAADDRALLFNLDTRNAKPAES